MWRLAAWRLTLLVAAAQVTRHRQQEPPRHWSHRLRTALYPVSFRTGRICPALSAPPQQTAEGSDLRPTPVPCTDDEIRRMADVSWGPGAAW